ncbi:trypsin-like peptidase domain-containing protein [Mucilaginibacter sp. R-33]|uniref:trypsin-like peptidase domain-containing protein n=1 Tax=Mucilaginibacter sp. R-33 TaxID=3416711 RepID=UPI003CFA8B0F
MKLNGPQLGKLRRIVTDLYQYPELQRTLSDRFDQQLHIWVEFNAGYETQVQTLLQKINNKGWIDRLISGFQADFPEDEALLKFISELDMLIRQPAAQQGGRPGLERVLNAAPSINPANFLVGLARCKRCVCRIDISTTEGDFSGTGFLIWKDLVISNYHVFQELIETPEKVQSILCKFDYELSPDGNTINPGMDVRLAAGQPVIAYSKFSPLDADPPENIDAAWTKGELDYAIVRLERAVSEEPFGIKQDQVSQAPARGWIDITSVTALPKPGNPIVILQHPDSRPLEMVIDLSGITALDPSALRVRYSVNTEGGSSGSPCFDEKFGVIALHNVGDPKQWKPTYNQGIPMVRIAEDLRNKQISLDI